MPKINIPRQYYYTNINIPMTKIVIRYFKKWPLLIVILVSIRMFRYILI